VDNRLGQIRAPTSLNAEKAQEVIAPRPQANDRGQGRDREVDRRAAVRRVRVEVVRLEEPPITAGVETRRGRPLVRIVGVEKSEIDDVLAVEASLRSRVGLACNVESLCLLVRGRAPREERMRRIDDGSRCGRQRLRGCPSQGSGDERQRTYDEGDEQESVSSPHATSLGRSCGTSIDSNGPSLTGSGAWQHDPAWAAGILRVIETRFEVNDPVLVVELA
jgi:hypothetical protein